MKVYRNDILKEIRKVRSLPHRKLMRSIVNFLFKNRHISEIGISQVKEFIATSWDDSDILICLMQLCIFKKPLLRVEYEYFEDEDTYYPVEFKDIKLSEESGFFTHPNTGNVMPLENCSQNIFMYFKVNKLGGYEHFT